MIKLQFYKTRVYQAVAFGKQLPFWFLGSARNICIVTSAGLLVLIFLSWFQPTPQLKMIFQITTLYRNQFTGLFVLFGGFASILTIWSAFLRWLETPRPKRELSSALKDIKSGGENLASYLDFEVMKAVIEAKSFVRRKLEGVPFSMALLLETLNTESAQFILMRLGINPKSLKNEMELNLAKAREKSKSLEEILIYALEVSYERKRSFIGIGDLLTALAKNDEFFYKFLFSFELDEEDVKNVSYWQESIFERAKKAKQFWSYENLMRVPGVGKGWASGYTINLDKFSRDLTREVEERGLSLHLIGHDKEIKEIERILAKAGENNVLIVGEVGVGKTTVIYGLAKMIYEGTSLPEIEHKRVLEIDIDSLIAGIENLGKMEARLITIFEEAIRAKNIILVINQFDNFVGKAYGLGKIDISSIIIPFLGSKHFQVIGVTDYTGFHKYIEQNSAIIKLFKKVEIKEPDEREALLVLADIVPLIEARNKILVTYQALRDCVKKANIYIQDVAMPERAIDLLEETAVYVSAQKKEKVVLPEHIDAVLTEKTGIPIGKMAEEETEKLINLEEILHKRLINQEEAINAIASTMRRARTGITGRKRPVGSFLFLGPTGVGKTETAKTLAEAYFGHEEKMIRFDMSEYQDIDSIRRFIGSIEMGEPGQLANAVRENPFSLVLLDEIDKAHPDILNLFLQVLDEGFLTDAFGKRVNFRNIIIIATSNAGANLIREAVQAGLDPAALKNKVLDFIQSKGIFRPEFINRFDGTIVYHLLSSKNLLEVAQLMLKDLARRLEEKDIKLVVSEELLQKVAELGYEPQFGARPMRRVIQDKIENLIATKILKGEIKRGDTITINPADLL